MFSATEIHSSGHPDFRNCASFLLGCRPDRRTNLASTEGEISYCDICTCSNLVDNVLIGVRVVEVEYDTATHSGSTNSWVKGDVICKIVDISGEDVEVWQNLVYKTACAYRHLSRSKCERLEHVFR